MLEVTSKYHLKCSIQCQINCFRYAANVLVYPEGEWLGNLHTENVPEVLDSILARHVDSEKSPIPLCPAFWRGRMGLHKEEQLVLASNS